MVHQTVICSILNWKKCVKRPLLNKGWLLSNGKSNNRMRFSFDERIVQVSCHCFSMLPVNIYSVNNVATF